jgi:hypothetical protein
MAEREGFEPSIRCYPYTRFPSVRLQPLGHLSTWDAGTSLGDSTGLGEFKAGFAQCWARRSCRRSRRSSLRSSLRSWRASRRSSRRSCLASRRSSLRSWRLSWRRSRRRSRRPGPPDRSRSSRAGAAPASSPCVSPSARAPGVPSRVLRESTSAMIRSSF